MAHQEASAPNHISDDAHRSPARPPASRIPVERGVAGRLLGLLGPDTPWRRAAEVAAVLSLALTLVASGKQENGANYGAGGNILPSAKAAPPGVRNGSELNVTLDCVPSGCRSGTARLEVAADASGVAPMGQEVYLLSRDETTRRWLLHTPIIADADGHWSASITIDDGWPGRAPRQISLHAVLLPSSRIDELRQRQQQVGGAGLDSTELPYERRELMCVPAIIYADHGTR